MKTILIYFFTILLSNTLGAISGMGGGVIIKPVLDTIGLHSLKSITFYSSIAVFTMSISSIYKQIRNSVMINYKNVLGLSIGSLIGGVFGDIILTFFISFFKNDHKVQVIQYILMIFTLLLILYYNKFSNKKLNLSKLHYYILIGILLGSLSTFLGIGGGPINVAMFIFAFSLDIKTAVVYSIVTIFFSQLAKLSTIALTTGFGMFDLKMLFCIIPAALLGGYIGSKISFMLSEKRVLFFYNAVVVFIIFINIYNLISVCIK
ncbi:sulfite exporter TauE/SafE family protein [Bacillus chungangensis]|uniref:Probable membrane transporter protein n=1 Tax=Bacillus chungangensis TaxID=587633 RepID=A0ABT9WXY1_9BACI|nr:sulfite exporter TauE/SafE family protein [Bacillus chungangensis]MDQ0177615.1 putative membrane protein YfcA [Bacillus chungangensis]